MRTRLLLLATMLTVATGCDKKGAGPALTDRPPVLFQVFGGRDDPRVVPVAFLDSAGPRAMELTPAQWREFDSLYTRGGDSLLVYAQGRPVGSARVQRGMWEGDAPLYTLPNCANPLPQASVRVAVDAPVGNVVEFLASSHQLPADTTAARRPMPLGPLVVTGIAREFAAREAQAAKIPDAVLDSLDFRAHAAHTGSTTGPTIVASFVDPSGGEGVPHLFLVADHVSGNWAVTYRSVFARAGREDRLQRYVDRIDLTGDGTAELVLEEWTLGGGARPVVLSWTGERWEETWRGRNDWCVAK